MTAQDRYAVQKASPRPSAILTFHSLDDSGSVISFSPSRFRSEMEMLAGSGIPIVPLENVTASPGSVAITFDDGYGNVLDHGIPVLEKYRLPATLFVVSRFCGADNQWPGQSAGVPRLPLLAWSDLITLPEHIDVGAHTATHPRLDRLSPAECESELLECRQDTEQRLGRKVHSLAYPYGAFSPGVKRMASRHFRSAAGTSLGYVAAGCDRYNLPRVDAYYLRKWPDIVRLFTRQAGVYIQFRHVLRTVRSYCGMR